MMASVLLVNCGKKEYIVAVPKKVPIEHVLDSATGQKMSDVIISPAELGDRFYGVDWTFSRKFDTVDIAMTRLCVRFLEEVTGTDYPESYYNLYWSDDMLGSMGRGSLLGMTVYYDERKPWKAYIGIASELKPKSMHDLNAIRDFASTVIHEFEHAVNLTVEDIVRTKIDLTIDKSFDFACAMPVTNMYRYQPQYINAPYDFMIEKAAFTAGIMPPWYFERDYADPMRPFFNIMRMLIAVKPPTPFIGPTPDTNMALTNITILNITTNTSNTPTNLNFLYPN